MRTPEELRDAYYAGSTIEELSLEEETYTGKIRKILKEAGTVMRKPGEKIPGKKSHFANESPPPNASEGTGVHRISSIGSPPRKGYRRRGRL